MQDTLGMFSGCSPQKSSVSDVSYGINIQPKENNTPAEDQEIPHMPLVPKVGCFSWDDWSKQVDKQLLISCGTTARTAEITSASRDDDLHGL